MPCFKTKVPMSQPVIMLLTPHTVRPMVIPIILMMGTTARLPVCVHVCVCAELKIDSTLIAQQCTYQLELVDTSHSEKIHLKN